MVENKEASPVSPAVIYRIIDALNWPTRKARNPRTEANILIEDALAKRTVAKAGKALEEKIGKGGLFSR